MLFRSYKTLQFQDKIGASVVLGYYATNLEFVINLILNYSFMIYYS